MTPDSAQPRTWPLWFGGLALAAAWLVHITGGTRFSIGPFRISARSPTPLLVVAGLLVAVLIARRGALWRIDLPAALDSLDRYARSSASVIAIAVGVTGLVWGTFTVGGSDSHCYAALARSYAHGALFLTEPLALEAPWPEATQTFAPIGFLASSTRPGAFVPKCAPGFALVLAPFLWMSGYALFVAVPLAGVLLVAATWRLGAMLGGPRAGLIAAVLMGTAPVLLYQVVQPMSDVPAAAALAWGLVWLTASPRRPTAAGLATGLLLLIRPNLLPVGIVMVAAMATAPGGRLTDTLRFAASTSAVAWPVPVLNAIYYGAPWATGYGGARFLFSIAYVPINAPRYLSWLVDTMTPLILLGAAGPWLHRADVSHRFRAWTLIAVAAAVTGCYLPYVPFTAWWYLRFLLPALPSMCALAAAVVVAAMGRCSQPVAAGLTFLLIAGVFTHATSASIHGAVYDLWRLERRLPATAEYVVSHVARPAAFAKQASGALSFAGVPTVSWDNLDPAWLDRATTWLATRGYTPVVAIDGDLERAWFAGRFAPHTEMGRLLWPPRARVNRAVEIYDLHDHDRLSREAPFATERYDRVDCWSRP
jgi:hypothetical protein